MKLNDRLHLKMLSDDLENKPEYLYEQIKKTVSGYS